MTENIIRTVPAGSVLEIGSGEYSYSYIKEGEDVAWRKLDLFPPCDIVCDLNREGLILPVEDQTFDLILCTEVLEHLLWPQRLLEEMHRILAPGGKILLSVPNIASLAYRIAWLMGRIPSCAASGNLPMELCGTAYRKDNGDLLGGHVVDFNLQRLVALLDHAGFAVIRRKGSGIVWHRQIVPHWMVPASLASNIIVLAWKE